MKVESTLRVGYRKGSKVLLNKGENVIEGALTRGELKFIEELAEARLVKITEPYVAPAGDSKGQNVEEKLGSGLVVPAVDPPQAPVPPFPTIGDPAGSVPKPAPAPIITRRVAARGGK